MISISHWGMFEDNSAELVAAFEKYALKVGVNIGKVHGQYFYNETKMAFKDFSAGYLAGKGSVD